MSIIEGLRKGFEKNRDYGVRLVCDLSVEQMILQPDGQRTQAVNHPAWVFSHLNVYLPIIQALVENQTFEDPKEHQFGMQSKPEMDGSIYESKDSLLEAWNAGHNKVDELLTEATDGIFSQPVKLERWSTVMPNAGICLPYLMLNHENQHLGQISAWRRVLGLPSV